MTWLLTAAAARWIAGISWPEALLVGAVLSPTDPVFAAAIVGREEIPIAHWFRKRDAGAIATSAG